MEDIMALESAVSEIIGLARARGLDFFPMRFEICPADVIYAFSAYGMPTRFSHWSFGKSYYRIKMRYDYGLNRIYEMVINTDPCYAFLLSSNSLIQNKLIIAHVIAHSDFFKNNSYFSYTSRQMIDEMARSAERIRGYETLYGREHVEEFLNAVLAIQEHIDPYDFIEHLSAGKQGRGFDGRKAGESCDAVSGETFSEQENDLLRYIAENSPALAEWERDAMKIVHSESLYFWPQLATKILNEGWATFWHLRLLRELELDEADAVEFARMHAELIQPGKRIVNPYLFGLRILEDIERRFGREKLFEIREVENDVSLVRNYLTPELVKELDLYVYRQVGQDWRVTTKDWERVREALLANMINGGNPYIVVVDGNYNSRGELYLRHVYEGVELDVRHLEHALKHVYRLWGRPVHLETSLDGRPAVFCSNRDLISKSII
ncbi:MAG: SpoVR family protein [Bacillota bacterium]